MPRYIALEWDSREARVAVAQSARGAVAIEHAFAVALSPRDVSPRDGAPRDGAVEADVPDTDKASELGRRISQELAARRISRAETLVSVGRASIELKPLTLPPSPDDELPDLVRFQALREFTSLAESWPLDYIPIGDDPTQPRSVLAAAISPELVGQIHETCRTAGLAASRVVLRPCAAASLLRRRLAGRPANVRLLVDLVTDEADLTVLSGDAVVFIRTARLPSGATHSASERTQALLNEIRRTLAAVSNQLGSQRIEQIFLCGLEDDYGPLAAQIDAQLKLPVEAFNPLEGLPLADELRRRPPEHSGRFAPLLGMLLDEAEGRRHALDFLNPHKRPVPPSRRRLVGLAAGVAATIAASVAFVVWYQLRNLDDRIAELQTDVNRNKQDLARAQPTKETMALDKWCDHEVLWLDELRQLSEKFPPGDQTMLARLRITVSEKAATMQLDGVAKSSAIKNQVEANLRDKRHRVEGQNAGEDAANPRYPWQFNTSVTVVGDEPPLAATARGPRSVSPAGAKAAAPRKARP